MFRLYSNHRVQKSGHLCYSIRCQLAVFIVEQCNSISEHILFEHILFEHILFEHIWNNFNNTINISN